MLCFSQMIENTKNVFILGKSNLLDAISFVVGEKASSLRVRKLSVNKHKLLLCVQQ